jgi:GNAT superfamily N-acetyltransferase
MNNVVIRRAKESEDCFLTQIAFDAKRHWQYPESWMEKWINELTISKDYIKYNKVYVAEMDSRIVGFYSIAFLQEEMMFGKIRMEQGYWLDHMFIMPEYHHKGIGCSMMQHIQQSGVYSHMHIFVDPHATGFYEKMGAKFVRSSPSSIEGRDIPVYSLNC